MCRYLYAAKQPFGGKSLAVSRDPLNSRSTSEIRYAAHPNVRECVLSPDLHRSVRRAQLRDLELQNRAIRALQEQTGDEVARDRFVGRNCAKESTRANASVRTTMRVRRSTRNGLDASVAPGEVGSNHPRHCTDGEKGRHGDDTLCLWGSEACSPRAKCVQGARVAVRAKTPRRSETYARRTAAEKRSMLSTRRGEAGVRSAANPRVREVPNVATSGRPRARARPRPLDLKQG